MQEPIKCSVFVCAPLFTEKCQGHAVVKFTWFLRVVSLRLPTRSPAAPSQCKFPIRQAIQKTHTWMPYMSSNLFLTNVKLPILESILQFSSGYLIIRDNICAATAQCLVCHQHIINCSICQHIVCSYLLQIQGESKACVEKGFFVEKHSLGS